MVLPGLHMYGLHFSECLHFLLLMTHTLLCVQGFGWHGWLTCGGGDVPRGLGSEEKYALEIIINSLRDGLWFWRKIYI